MSELRMAARRGARRIGLGVADQFVASAGNAVAGLLVARRAESAQLGAFAVTFGAYALAVGVSRAMVSEPLAVFHAGDGRLDARRPLGAALVAGAAIGALLLTTGVLVGGPAGSALVVLAVALPLLLCQDVGRSVFLVTDRPGQALANDALWTTVAVVALATVDAAGTATVAVALWAGAGAAAGVFACVQAGALPRPSEAGSWFASNRVVTGSLVVEHLLNAGGRHVALLLAAVVGGLAVSGSLHAAQLAFGPVVALQVAVPFVAYQEAARWRSGGHRTVTIGVGVAGAVTGSCLTWAALLAILPPGWVDGVLGDSADAARRLLVPTAVLLSTVAVNLGALTVLRAERAFRASRRVRVVSTVGLIASAAGGASTTGATGAAWSMAIVNGAFCLVWWRAALRAATREENG